MAVTVASFAVSRPEFANTAASDPDYVQAMIDEASLEVDAEVWGDKADAGIMWLAAHKLALSPYGNNAELVAKDGKTTTYKTHYDALVMQVGHGFRVT